MATRKSSLHIKPRSIPSSLLHNERVYDLSYSVRGKEHNEDKLFIKRKDLIHLLPTIKSDYQKHSYRGRKLPSTATPIREGVVNLEAHHTMEDVEKMAKKVAEKMGIEILSISIHRDEGKNKNEINYHAHILFNYYNFDTHKIAHQNSQIMQKVQSLVAQELGMQRGASKKITKRKHIPHGQYRTHAKELEKVKAPLIEKVGDLKIEIEMLRKQMIEKNKEEKIYSKEDYQVLAKLKKSAKKSNLTQIVEEFLQKKSEFDYKSGYHEERLKSMNIEEYANTLEQKIKAYENDFEIEYEIDESGNVDGILVHRDVVRLEKNHKRELQALEKESELENIALKAENQALKAEIDTLPSSDAFEELKTLKSDSETFSKQIEELKEVITEKDGEFEKLEEEFTLYKKSLALVLAKLEHPLDFIKKLFDEAHERLVNPKDETEKCFTELLTRDYEKKIPTQPLLKM